MEKYFFAKIDKGNRSANIYLKGNGEINSPALPIYFDSTFDNSDEFLKSGNAKEQGKHFFECGKNCVGKFIIVIYEGKVHILRPSGPVVFCKSTVRDLEGGYVKLLPVEIITSVSIAQVPMVLAGIGANRYYSSGTFREISDVGNILAIKTVLGESIEIPASPSVIHAIQCLSSVEFETLIAKLFEEAGCFVPAYRGGNMQGADLFVHNKTNKSITLGEITLRPDHRNSIQVKLNTAVRNAPPGVDFLIAGNIRESPNTFGAAWLKKALMQSPTTKKWLFQSLEWLPKQYLNSLGDAF